MQPASVTKSASSGFGENLRKTPVPTFHIPHSHAQTSYACAYQREIHPERERTRERKIWSYQIIAGNK